MTIVGLPDTAVQESRERVQAVIKNVGLPYPRKRIVVNLAPVTVRKEGPAYDLPIALGVLIMHGLLPPDFLTLTGHIVNLAARLAALRFHRSDFHRTPFSSFFRMR